MADVNGRWSIMSDDPQYLRTFGRRSLAASGQLQDHGNVIWHQVCNPSRKRYDFE
jgi:hypothetical protein